MNSNKCSKISDIDAVAIWTVGSLLFFSLGFFIFGDRYLGFLFVGYLVWMLLSAIVAASYMWDKLEKERRR